MADSDSRAHSCRQHFIVARQLGADALLRCTFVDSQVYIISVRKRVCELWNGEVIPVVRHRAPEQTEEESPEVGARARAPQNSVRVSQRALLAHGSEMNVQVTCPVGGVRILEPLSSIYDTKRVSLRNGVIDVRPIVPFKVKVAHFGSTEVTLSNAERLGFAIEA